MFTLNTFYYNHRLRLIGNEQYYYQGRLIRCKYLAFYFIHNINYIVKV